MRLNHVALWADDIESVRLFYMKYFGALCNDRYVNESKKFTSYFLSFDEGTACLELMNRPDKKLSTSLPDVCKPMDIRL